MGDRRLTYGTDRLHPPDLGTDRSLIFQGEEATMAPQTTSPDLLENTTTPPRERILKAARQLFYRSGIHAISVDAVAEAARTNKTTLYRHFQSKDELVAECLREYSREFEKAWAEIERVHAGKPKGQLLAYLRLI